MLINKENILNVFYCLFFVTILLVSLYGRSFIGLTINGFRLGEFIVLFSLLMFVLLIPKVFAYFTNSRIDKIYLNLYLGLIISFFIVVLSTGSNFLDPYTYRASSHIFLTSFFILGLVVSSYFLQNKIFFYLLIFSSIGVYILSTTYFPQEWINFFTKYSDKFDFVKGSDLLLLYILVNFLGRNLLDKKKSFTMFLFLSALYFPLLLFKSKGAFIPLVIYIAYEILESRNYIIKNKLRTATTLAISIIIFMFSTFQTWGGLSFTRDVVNQSIQSDEISISGTFQEKIQETFENKNTIESFVSFYVIDKRLYSTDFTANWRLQIWQDVFSDTYHNNLIFFGYGYKDIIPAMQDDTRTGNDQLNQNVHNFIVNIYARGGILQLLVFVSFYFFIFKKFLFEKKSRSLLLYIIPIFITSFFDSSMETVRFPLIFYTFLGIICSKNFSNKNQKVV